MPFGLKSIWVQLAVEATEILWFVWQFGHRYLAGAFDGPEGAAALGRTMLWFMAAVVVGVIAAHVLGLIAIAIAKGGEEPDTTMDERDRAIEFSGQRVSHALGGIGFLAGMVILAFGGTVLFAVAAMFVAAIGGEIAGNVVKLLGYAGG